MGAARRGVKISCDQRGNIEGTEWNLIFSTLHCTPRRVAIDRNMSTAVLYPEQTANTGSWSGHAQSTYAYHRLSHDAADKMTIKNLITLI